MVRDWDFCAHAPQPWVYTVLVVRFSPPALNHCDLISILMVLQWDSSWCNLSFLFRASDSMFDAAIFPQPRIDKLFPGETESLPLPPPLSLPDVSLQLPWLTANSFITGHTRQVLHLKGRHPSTAATAAATTLTSITSEESTCENSTRGTPLH